MGIVQNDEKTRFVYKLMTSLRVLFDGGTTPLKIAWVINDCWFRDDFVKGNKYVVSVAVPERSF